MFAFTASESTSSWTFRHTCTLNCPTFCNGRCQSTASTAIYITTVSAYASPFGDLDEQLAKFERDQERARNRRRRFAQRTLRAPGRVEAPRPPEPRAPLLRQPFARVRACTMAAR